MIYSAQSQVNQPTWLRVTTLISVFVASVAVASLVLAATTAVEFQLSLFGLVHHGAGFSNAQLQIVALLLCCTGAIMLLRTELLALQRLALATIWLLLIGSLSVVAMNSINAGILVLRAEPLVLLSLLVMSHRFYAQCKKKSDLLIG